MKNTAVLLVAVMIALLSCQEAKKKTRSPVVKTMGVQQDCANEEVLIYEKDGFSSYTDDKIRGQGVVSFDLNTNDRLNIYNEDDSEFGYLVLNEDQTFFTLHMPRKFVAREVIPEFDFAAFDFDAEPENTSEEYLIIYANGDRRKVKKAELKYRYRSWSDYVKEQSVALKPCTLLKNTTSLDHNIFDVLAIDGERINIKLKAGCADEGSKNDTTARWIKWRNNDLLVVNFEDCNY